MELMALIAGAGPSIETLMSRCPEPFEVEVNGRMVKLKLVHVMSTGEEDSLSANSALLLHVDVVVVLESVRMLLVCTRAPGDATSGSVGGLTAQNFIGDEASCLAEELGVALLLVASEAHLRGLALPRGISETTREEFQATAEALGGIHLELSAETGEGVDAFLNTAARLALHAWNTREMQAKLRQLRGKRLERRSNSWRRGDSPSPSPSPSRRASESMLGVEGAFNPSWVRSLLCASPRVPKTEAGETAAEAPIEVKVAQAAQRLRTSSDKKLQETVRFVKGQSDKIKLVVDEGLDEAKKKLGGVASRDDGCHGETGSSALEAGQRTTQTG